MPASSVEYLFNKIEAENLKSTLKEHQQLKFDTLRKEIDKKASNLLEQFGHSESITYASRRFGGGGLTTETDVIDVINPISIDIDSSPTEFSLRQRPPEAYSSKSGFQLSIGRINRPQAEFLSKGNSFGWNGFPPDTDDLEQVGEILQILENGLDCQNKLLMNELSVILLRSNEVLRKYGKNEKAVAPEWFDFINTKLICENLFEVKSDDGSTIKRKATPFIDSPVGDDIKSIRLTECVSSRIKLQLENGTGWRRGVNKDGIQLEWINNNSQKGRRQILKSRLDRGITDLFTPEEVSKYSQWLDVIDIELQLKQSRAAKTP